MAEFGNRFDDPLDDELDEVEGYYKLPDPHFREARPATPEDRRITWGDWATAAASGAVGIGANVSALGELLSDGRFGGETRHALDEYAGVLMERTSPRFRRQLEANLLGGDHDSFVSSLMSKAVTTSPSLIASIIPGIAVAKAYTALGGSRMGAAIAGSGAARSANASMHAGDVANEIFESIDNMSDEELAAIPAYAEILEQVGDPAKARQQYMIQVADYAPLAAGAVTGLFPGVEGQIAGQVGRGVSRGIMHGITRGAGREALQEGVEEGTGEIFRQDALIDAGLAHRDWMAVLHRTFEGAAIGSVLGGTAGGVFGAATGRRQAPDTQPTPDTTQTGRTAPPAQPGVQTTATPVTVPDGQPSPEQAAAIEVIRTPGRRRRTPVETSQPVPQEVSEAAERIQQPVAPEPVPEPAPQPVPQEVSEASQRVAPQPVAQPEPAPPPRAAQPVPQEVTQPEPTPAPTPTRQPRILQSKRPEDTEAAKEARAANRRLISENLKRMKQEEQGPQGKHRTKAEVAKRESDAEAAKRIFDQRVPETDTLPTTQAQRQELKSRLDLALGEAQEAGVTVPAKVTESTPDHVVWLREAKDLATRLGRKDFVGARAREHITSFLTRERAAKGGDFSVMRSERRAEGELQKRVSQGDVEQKAAPVAGTDLEARDERVETKVTKTKRGPVRDTRSEEQEASPVRKVEITDELRKKYETPAQPKTKPAPKKPSTKVAEVKEKAKTKAEAKPKTPKARVAKAAKETDRSPTEAQKAAGNYQKGKASVHGLQIAIETPKGHVRKERAPDGTEREVRAPDHHGYIRGTEGADGNQIAAYFGPRLDDFSEVYVIDQLDPETGRFDGHKVMLGYANARAAMDTWMDGFSDKRGAERFGDVRVMSLDEFKAWLDGGRRTQPAGEVTSEVPAPAFVETQQPTVAQEPITDLAGWLEQRALYKGDFGDFTDLAKSMLREHTGPWFGAQGRADLSAAVSTTFPQLLNRIAATTDTRTFVVSDEAFGQITNPRHGGVFRPAENVIVLPERLINRPDAFPILLMHEGSHAAFMKATWNMRHVRSAVERVARAATAELERRGVESTQYAFTNIDEFIAESFSNISLQQFLASTEAGPELRSALRALKASKIGAPIRNLWDAFTSILARVLGLGSGEMTLLDAMMKIGAELEMGALDFSGPMTRAELQTRHDENAVRLFMDDSPWHGGRVTDETARSLIEDAQSFLRRTPQEGMQEQARTPHLWLRALDQIALISNDFFGKGARNPVRKVFNVNEQMRVTGDQIFRGDQALIAEWANLEKKYQGEQWNEFADLLLSETMVGAFVDRPLASQPHLGKDALHGKHAKAHYPELRARFEALPDDLKALRRKGMKFFEQRQNEMAFDLLKNRLLKVMGITDEALAQRLFDGKETEADIEALGLDYDTIVEAKELAKIEGPYFPMMRHGEWVAQAKIEIAPPTDAVRQIDDNTWEFDSREKAIAFGERQDTHPTIRSRWVDKNTGDPWVTDADGRQRRILKQDTDAEQRFRVTVQDRILQFHDTQREAQVAAHGFEQAGLDTRGVEAKRWHPHEHRVDMLSSQMQRVVQGLERRDGYRNMSPEQKNELIQAMAQASIRMLGSTRIQSRRLQRTFVEGASRDVTQTVLTYSKSSSGYLARLKHQPAMDEAITELEAAVADDTRNYGKAGSSARSEIANAVKKRIYDTINVPEPSKWQRWAQRFMTASFVDKLVGVSYSVVNSTQPTMIHYPALAARYGPGVAFRELSRAYDSIGALSTLGEGLRRTVQRARTPTAEFTSFLDEVKARVSTREAQLLDYLAERGTIDPQSGMEIDRLVRSRQGGAEATIDQGLDYLQGIGRQLPIAVETVNRSVAAISTYRLEMKRNGGNHDAAVEVAQEMTNATQFVYSTTNAPPIFNHPVARIALQFRKFGQGLYAFIGYNIGKALRNANPGDRAEAARTLGYLSGMHIATAGLIGGLPTEPFKFLLLGAQPFLGFSWDDVERAQREALADFAGPTWGEALSRGMPRLIGVDVSTRINLNQLIAFGEPREFDETGVWAWVARTAAGAPPALVADWVKGAGELSNGEFVKAAELMIPIKQVSDGIRAYRQATEGKKTAAGHETMSPYTPAETLTRALGFTPAREAETFERQSSFYKKTGRQTDQRTEFMREWAAATPSDRSRLWTRIVAWNRGRPRDARITRDDLRNYLQRQRTEAKRGTIQDGMRITRQNRHIMDELNRTFNLP